MYDDVAKAFGPLTSLVARRKRALRLYEEHKNFRWHGAKHLSEARLLEVDIRFALFIGE